MPIRIGGYKDFPEHAKTPVPRLGGNRAPYSYSVVLWPLLGVALTGVLRAPYRCNALTTSRLPSFFVRPTAYCSVNPLRLTSYKHLLQVISPDLLLDPPLDSISTTPIAAILFPIARLAGRAETDRRSRHSGLVVVDVSDSPDRGLVGVHDVAAGHGVGAHRPRDRRGHLRHQVDTATPTCK